MTEALSRLSDALAETVARAAPSVVRVEARRRIPASGIVWSADGTIVTAHHVVERDEGIRVGFADGSDAEASLVGRDPTTDVAVLRVQSSGLRVADRAPVDALKVGHLSLAIARPGTGPRASMGVVGAVGDPWTSPGGGRLDRYVQPDVAMGPGFSGGPLVDAEGRVIGMNTSGLLRTGAVTVPVETLERVVATLLAHGRVRRGYLGVGTQPVDLPAAEATRLGQETGLLIVSVAADSAASSAGLLVGDILVHAADTVLEGVDDLRGKLASTEVGSTIGLDLLRGGQAQKVDATLGDRPS